MSYDPFSREEHERRRQKFHEWDRILAIENRVKQLETEVLNLNHKIKVLEHLLSENIEFYSEKIHEIMMRNKL